MKIFSNKELKTAFLEMQNKHSNSNNKVSIKQNETVDKVVVKIYWEYIQYLGKESDCWTLTQYKNHEDYPQYMVIVYNEHDEFMNNELEYSDNMKSAVESSAYYMNTRY